MPRRPADLLMWVGANHYPTVESFVTEVEVMGVSKRVSQVPAGVRPGQSLLFLAHDEAARVRCEACRGLGVSSGGIVAELVERKGRRWVAVDPPERRPVASAAALKKLHQAMYAGSGRSRGWRAAKDLPRCTACAGRGEVPAGRIFGVCLIGQVDLVFDCQSAADEYRGRMERFEHKDRVSMTYVIGGMDDGRRRCGYRKIGGTYLTACDDALQKLQDLAGRVGGGARVVGPLVVFGAPVAYPGGRFLGAKLVDGATILRSVMAMGRVKRARRPTTGARRRRGARGSAAVRRDRCAHA